MALVILDASALIACLKDEPGAKLVEGLLDDSAISTVNWAEVVQSMGFEQISREELRRILPMVQVVPFLEAHAEVAGELGPMTRSRGLSLADRACLVTAMFRNCPAVTADRAWEGLEIDVEIKLIR